MTGPAVLLHGSEGRSDALLLLRRETGARAMLAQDMSLRADGMAHIDRVTEMAERMWCATRVHHDLDDAALLLDDTFARPDLAAVHLACPIVSQVPVATRPEIDLTVPWARNPEVGLRRRLGAADLWAPWSGRFFHLNPIGLDCW